MSRGSLSPHMIRQLRRFKKTETVERCGLVLKNSVGDLAFCEAENIHADPEKHFSISFLSYRTIKYTMEGWNLHAIFHTHVEWDNKEPSENDFEKVAYLRVDFPGTLGMVLHVPTRLVSIYDGDCVLSTQTLPMVRRAR